MTALSLLKNKEDFYSLKFPLLSVPEIRFNSNIECVSEEYRKWSAQFPDHNEKSAKLNETFAGLLYHTCKSKEDLLNCVKAIDFSVYLDQWLEPIRKEKSAEKMIKLMADLENAIDNNSCDEKFYLGQRLIQGINGIKPKLTGDQINFIHKELKKHFRANVEFQCNFLVKNRFIPLDQYLSLRIYESGWRYLSFPIEYSLQNPMPEELRNNELMAKFYDKVMEYLLAIDDLYMFKAKMVTNDMTSHVMSYAFYKKCSVQESIDYQYRYAMDLETECKELMNELRDKTITVWEPLDEYMNSLISLGYATVQVFRSYFGYELRDGLIYSKKWKKMDDILRNDCSEFNPFDF